MRDVKSVIALVVYRVDCMVLFNSQTRRHVIKINNIFMLDPLCKMILSKD